jgi:tRNA pseudouridine38-40 synthase
MRIALGIEYCGKGYHGWQAQQRVLTLQTTLEMALSKVANEPIKVFCAGRTDAGVHATHQIIHFDTQANRVLDAWILGTNSHLPKSISVQWAKPVDETFHARFSALSRRYHYLVYNRPARPSLCAALTTWVSYPLDEQRMHQAAQQLMGEHDFTSFRSAECQSNTPKRHIFSIHVFRKQDFVVLDITANSFLHHMVRNIMGVLLEIGSQKKEVSWCSELLAAKNRNLASKTASPQGLYLTGVRYPDVYELASHFRAPFLMG